MRARILLLAVAGALSLAVAGPAAAFDATSVLSGANALRAQAGVRPLVLAAAAEVSVDRWIVEDDGLATPAETMGSWPKLLAWLLDPRTTRAAFEEPGNGTVTLSLGTDETIPLVRPVLPVRLDPASPSGIALLLPARPLSVQLLETRGGTEVSLPVRVVRARGAGGAWLAQLDRTGDGPRLAYAARYRVLVDGRSFSYVTDAVPKAYLRRSWRFGTTMRPADQSAFERALATAPPFARRLIEQIDGAVRVSRSDCDELGTSCSAYLDDGTYTLSISPADFADTFDDLRFVTLHEFGHLVDYVGLDETAYAAFNALFRTSPRWRSCFPDDTSETGCVEFAEIFADQFAFWATGLSHDPGGGYGDPPLVDRAAFGRVLQEHYAFRPPLWRNPVVALH